MTKEEFIILLKSNQKLIEGTLNSTKRVQIEGLKISFDKKLKINCENTINFSKCIFGKIEIEDNTKFAFNECLINMLTLKNATAYVSASKGINKISVNAPSFLTLDTTKNIERLSVTFRNSKKLFLFVMNSEIGSIELLNKDAGDNNIKFDNVICNTLRFEDYDLNINSSVLFHTLTVKEHLLFYKSKLGNTKFHSCDFSKAYNIIYESTYNDAYFINISWFSKVYYGIKLRKQKFYDKFITPSIIKKLGNIKFLNIGKQLKFFKSREYYEAYREYKTMMYRLNNRPDAIYFKSKEYNAKLKQLSWWSKDFSDKLILVLNKYTNNHGKYWILPIFWILLLGAFFFKIYFFNSSEYNSTIDNWSTLLDYYPYYLRFLNPTHKYKLLGDTIQLENVAMVSDLSFRIVSSYLIFQCITAFRKFKE